MDLILGTSKRDITPDRPVPLAGFSSRQGFYEGVSRPLHVRIWFFRQTDRDGRERQALLAQADLIWWGTDLAARVRRRLAERFGLPEEAIILHASHTHGGPQTSGMFPRGLGEADERYVAALAEKLEQAAEEACMAGEPVRVERGHGLCRIGINRRKRSGAGIEWAPNPDGPVDPEVTVIRFATKSGGTKGVWFHYTCHPTTTGDNQVTSEFPGVAMEAVEEALGGGSIASFLQGCCGDIRPNIVDGGEFRAGSDDDVVRLGCALRDEVLRVLASPLEPISLCELRGERHVVPLYFERMPDISELKERQEDAGVMGEWSRYLLAAPERRKAAAPLDMTALHIAAGLTLAAMSGEIVVAYGTYIKKRYGGNVLPLAYSNGMVGYVPTTEQLAEGGYESVESAYHFGLPSPFRPSVESDMITGLHKLLDETGKPC